MTTDNIIDLYNLACGGLLVWALAATLALWDERREREQEATTAPEAEDVTPTEIPENDIARIMPNIDDAKKELRAWQVELVYRLFKHN